MSSERRAAELAPGALGVDEPARESLGLAIRARGLSKAYHVYDHPGDRLKQIWWRGRRRLYQEFFALHGVDLDVRRGETIGIVGRNGSGKSTLLQLVCGTLEPTSGELEVKGHIAPILTLGAGFNPEFTGRENVQMNAAILGMSASWIRTCLEPIREFAEIGEFFDRPVKSYSSGMYSRLAFAVAVHADPEILVVDEILAVGDEAFTRKCFGRIEEIKSRGATILFVSHSPHLVLELCDRALLLETGKRLLTSDPKTVMSRYHKLLFSPRARREAIREEILELDRSSATLSRDGAGPEAPAPGPSAAVGHFDPGLVPKSTVEYGRGGARIHDARILCGDRPVNVLQSGGPHSFVYQVRFDEDAFGVRFGCMIKLVTGLELAGQVSHLAGEVIEHVEADSIAQVRFQFEARLAPGTYFMNAGVLAVLDGEETYLHRILDVLMFRVESLEGSPRTGFADLVGASPEVALRQPGPDERIERS